MLETSGLTSHYGRIPALQGIDFRIEPGELVALVRRKRRGEDDPAPRALWRTARDRGARPLRG